MGWLGEGLGDGPQLGIEKCTGEITTGLDIGRIRRSPQRGAHLLGDGQQRVADDLEADGIDVGGQRAERRGHGGGCYSAPRSRARTWVRASVTSSGPWCARCSRRAWL